MAVSNKSIDSEARLNKSSSLFLLSFPLRQTRVLVKRRRCTLQRQALRGAKVLRSLCKSPSDDLHSFMLLSSASLVRAYTLDCPGRCSLRGRSVQRSRRTKSEVGPPFIDIATVASGTARSRERFRACTGCTGGRANRGAESERAGLLSRVRGYRAQLQREQQGCKLQKNDAIIRDEQWTVEIGITFFGWRKK